MKTKKAVSASELAQMGVCERLVLFEHQCGKCSTARQRAAMRRGLMEHRRFYRDGLHRKGRCYVVALIFGDGWESIAFLLFRDRVLRPYAFGRRGIYTYYGTAPAVCRVLTRWPWLQPIIRMLLKPVACGLTVALSRNRGGHAN